MTDLEINIKIAEACGWTNIKEIDVDDFLFEIMQRWVGDHPKHGDEVLIPDFCNDLNAMHEAEKVLPKLPQFEINLCDIYYQTLSDIVAGDPFNLRSGFDVINATAKQKAEAFIKTIEQ